MAVREISARLSLDGEKQFNAAIKDAQRELRVMRSELKAEASAFEANGQKMQANEARVKSLRKQQEQQRKIIQALEQAVQESAETTGEASEKTDGYRIKLANARTELAKMEAQEKQFAEATKKAGKSVDDLKKEIGQDWKKMTQSGGQALRDLGTVAASVFASVAAGAATAGKSLYNWAVDAAHDSDDLLTTAMQSGIDVETLQSWQYAENFVDTSVDTILGSIKRLRKNMVSENKEIKGVFQASGVSMLDEAGNYRDAADVFWDIIDEIHNNPEAYANETETDNLLQTLFGKGYDELLPLINAGREEWDRIANEARSRDLVMDEGTVQAWGMFDDTLNRIQANIAATHQGIATWLVGDFNDVGKEVDEATSALNRFVHGDATPEEVAKEAADVVQAVVDAVKHGMELTNELIATLQASDDPNVRAVGDMLASIRDAGIELYKNKDNIKDGLEAILGVWAASKAAKAANNILSFATSLGKLVLHGGQLIAKGGRIGKAAEEAMGGGAAAAGAGVTKIGGGAMLGSILAGAATIAAVPAAVVAGSNYIRNTVDQSTVAHRPERVAAASDIDEVRQDLNDWIALQNELKVAQTDAQGKDLADRIAAIDAKYGAGGITGGSDLGQRYWQYVSRTQNAMDELPSVDAVLNLTPAENTQQTIQGALSSMRLSMPVQMIPVMGSVSASNYLMGSGGIQITGGSSTANLTVNLDGRAIAAASAPFINNWMAKQVGK